MMKSFYKIENVLFFFLSFGSVFIYSSYMHDEYIMPKWYFTYIALSLLFVVFPVMKILNKQIEVNIIAWSYIVIITCFAQSVFGILQYINPYFIFNFKNNGIGTYDNAAGFASSLCVVLPFSLVCLKHATRKILSLFICIIILFLILAVLISGSRTGLICITIFVFWGLSEYIKIKNKIRIVFSIFIPTLLLPILYLLKQDSANGRLLVWLCSWEMIKDSPIWGYGVGGFRKYYMDYQANYFLNNPSSQFSMLADNTLYPFNEFISFVLKFGIAGLVLLIIFFCFLFFCYFNKKTFYGRVALFSLLILSVFSLFSYPFTYPFIWIVVLLNIYILVAPYLSETLAIRNSRIVYVLFICVGVFGMCRTYKRVVAEKQWRDVMYSPHECLLEYPYLEKRLYSNPYFIYNYAVVLFENKQLKESLNKALRCRTYWADYELDLLIGNIYQKLGDCVMAECYFRNASLMCPCRFVPLYQLYELYKEQNEREKALLKAQEIIDKPIKVNSLKVMQIKRKVIVEFNNNVN